MKKTICLFALTALVLLSASAGYCGTSSGPIAVTADISAGSPDMTAVIHKLPQGNWALIDWEETLTTMDFDKFTVTQRPGQDPQWTTADHYAVFVYADGLGSQYQVTSSGDGVFTNGSDTLPVNSFACIPVYAAEDYWVYPDLTEVEQGDMPGAAVLGDKGPALVSNKVVYTSEDPGSARILQVHYAFPPYNPDGSAPYASYAPIPTTQANGTYSGVTATLNITAI
ncbi:MAG: hypothetical protein WC417_07240 [Candidatus Omnitrophota bacterium]|jgi:hypothetical protein